MYLEGKKAKGVKIAYIGGGSRGWARSLMSDLAAQEVMSGCVYLYDIDFAAAQDNQIIGNMMNSLPESKSDWQYFAVKTYAEALTSADFVVISILPGTFDEMQVDVHEPENYGIYQSVGDTVGPGGLVRALRTIPMFIEFAEMIKKYCPNAWVVNYTNPMTICVKTLYKAFPEIKAFGCCHEVFGTQEFIAAIYGTATGKKLTRKDVDVNIYGINHFTWVNQAKYRGEDLFPYIWEYAKNNKGENAGQSLNWMNRNFRSGAAVKLDLLKRYGVLGAAGDRHLVEFCPSKWYLKDPETLESWGVGLTSVDWRKNDLQERIKLTQDLISGKEKLEIKTSGEEGINQMIALLGLGSYITNVNIPNVGQIPNLPLGAVVETNAYFTGDNVTPLVAGEIPKDIAHLVCRHVYNQERIIESAFDGDYEGAFAAFINDPNMQLSLTDARELYNSMLKKTKTYLPHYDKYVKQLKK